MNMIHLKCLDIFSLAMVLFSFTLIFNYYLEYDSILHFIHAMPLYRVIGYSEFINIEPDAFLTCTKFGTVLEFPAEIFGGQTDRKREIPCSLVRCLSWLLCVALQRNRHLPSAIISYQVVIHGYFCSNLNKKDFNLLIIQDIFPASIFIPRSSSFF